MWIDAHQHFWRIAERCGSWPPPSLPAIHRDFLPSELVPHLSAGNVAGTVAVQSLPTTDDTAFLLDLASRHDSVLGVVGWVDLKARDAAPRIAELAQNAALKALRPMLQDLDDPDWIDDPALEPAISAMLEHGLKFDALVRPVHLRALLAFAQQYRDLPIVIDHGAKPAIATGGSPGWAKSMEALARLPNVHVKLSGLLTEAEAGVGIAAVAPYVETLLRTFGTSRMIWGSDWPVLNLAADYPSWLSMALSLVPGTAHADVFAGNARAFYSLAQHEPSPSGEDTSCAP